MLIQDDQASSATRVIAIILAFTVLGGTLAPAQGSKPQATNSTHVHAKNLDRYPLFSFSCLLSQ
jgi:hypothetical protein